MGLSVDSGTMPGTAMDPLHTVPYLSMAEAWRPMLPSTMRENGAHREKVQPAN